MRAARTSPRMRRRSASRAGTSASCAAARRRTAPPWPSCRRSSAAFPTPEADPAILGDSVRTPAARAPNELMTAAGLVDLLIPRGGAGLIRACVENATVPCIETGTGICHVYVDSAADLEKAAEDHCQRQDEPPLGLQRRGGVPCASGCGRRVPADAPQARWWTTAPRRGLSRWSCGCDPAAAAIIPGVPAGEKDFDTEFLDYILAVRVVDSLDEAIRHIAAAFDRTTATPS